MNNNTKQNEMHNKSAQQSDTLKKNKDTPKDYALELEFLGNAVWYKILSTTGSFGKWKLIWVCRPQKHLAV